MAVLGCRSYLRRYWAVASVSCSREEDAFAVIQYPLLDRGVLSGAGNVRIIQEDADVLSPPGLEAFYASSRAFTHVTISEGGTSYPIQAVIRLSAFK